MASKEIYGYIGDSNTYVLMKYKDFTQHYIHWLYIVAYLGMWRFLWGVVCYIGNLTLHYEDLFNTTQVVKYYYLMGFWGVVLCFVGLGYLVGISVCIYKYFHRLYVQHKLKVMTVSYRHIRKLQRHLPNFYLGVFFFSGLSASYSYSYNGIEDCYGCAILDPERETKRISACKDTLMKPNWFAVNVFFCMEQFWGIAKIFRKINERFELVGKKRKDKREREKKILEENTQKSYEVLTYYIDYIRKNSASELARVQKEAMDIMLSKKE